MVFFYSPVVSRASPRDAASDVLENILQKQASYAIIKQMIAEVLLQTDLSVGEIIRYAGYENDSFFRSIFKKKYGTTPLNYRKTRNIRKRC